MGEDKFKDLFSEDELMALQTAAAIAEAEVAAQAAQAAKVHKQDGIWYSHDENEMSLYEVRVGHKVLLWIRVDNAHEIQTPFHVPAGASAHAIQVWDAKRERFLDTMGIALRYEHADGSGTHIDGNTVRMYVLPRVSRWLGHFYGV